MRKRNIDALMYGMFFLLMATSLIYLILTQAINNYVHVRFIPYLWLSAIVLMIIAVAFIRMVNVGKNTIDIKVLLVMSLLFGIVLINPTTVPITTKVETLINSQSASVTPKKIYQRENLVISNGEYLQWFYDLHTHPDHYNNRLVEFSGKILEVNHNQLFVMRNVMFCCAADLAALGFNLDVPTPNTFKKDDWVNVKGIIKVKIDTKLNRSIVNIEVQSIQKIEKIKNEIIYP